MGKKEEVVGKGEISEKNDLDSEGQGNLRLESSEQIRIQLQTSALLSVSLYSLGDFI